MKKLIIAILTVLAVFHLHDMYKASDRYVRQRVLKLKDDRGSCSAIEVKAASGKSFVLTAAHCRLLVKNGKVKAEDEQGKEYSLALIGEDPTSDLMLLASPWNDGISVAKKIHSHEHVHTLTHGNGYPTFRTDGEYLTLDPTAFAISEITSIEDAAACTQPKNRVAFSPLTLQMVCLVASFQTITTAMVVPGSSGGALLNDSGQLIGIVSTTDGRFSSHVSLPDIQAFMKGR